MMRRTTHLLAAGVLLGAAAASAGHGAAAAQARTGELVSQGRTVATRHCGECHAIDAGQKSPLADAPPASELYRRFPVERMAEALELGMMNDHPRMPDFRLDPDERRALTAYLSSFAPAGRSRRGPAPPPPPPARGVIAAL